MMHVSSYRHVTVKAWLTGYYIVEYEQQGEDRAKYGDKLLQKLADRLGKGTTDRTLRLYRLFFLTYKSLANPVKDFIVNTLPIWQSPIAKLESGKNQEITIWQSVPAQLPGVNPELLFNRLLFKFRTSGSEI